MEINDVFEPQGSQGEPQAKPVVEQATEQAPAEVKPAEAAPPAAEEIKQVPLAALEAERAGRRDWKEKFLRLEGELNAYKASQQARAPAPPSDPMQQAVLAAQNERLDTSEMLAREKFGDEKVDQAYTKFQAMAQKDPTLHQKIMSQKHPWGALVKEVQRADLLEQVGDDPASFEEKLKAKWLAEQAATNQPAVPKPVLPTSLATARSAGPRTGTAFTGPPPLDTLFPN